MNLGLMKAEKPLLILQILAKVDYITVSSKGDLRK
jgi:hypothetical protein